MTEQTGRWLVSGAADRRLGESWAAYWARKHDERHGPACGCLWNRYGRIALRLPVPGVTYDTVPEGKRLALSGGTP